MFELKGKVAIVTGATGHLGKEMTIGLCEYGATVFALGRNKEKLNKLYNELSNYSIEILDFNLNDENEIIKNIDIIKKKYGRLDIIVNNAYNGRTATLEKSTTEDFHNSYKISVISSFNIIKYSEQLLAETASYYKTSPSIINISSMYGIVSPDKRIYTNENEINPIFYGSCKASIIQMTKYLSTYLGDKNIRVNCISPGPFPHPSIKKTNQEFYRNLCNKNPLGRIGKADELKGIIIFLASNASSYITGVNIPVDGGWTAW